MVDKVSELKLKIAKEIGLDPDSVNKDIQEIYSMAMARIKNSDPGGKVFLSLSSLVLSIKKQMDEVRMFLIKARQKEKELELRFGKPKIREPIVME